MWNMETLQEFTRNLDAYGEFYGNSIVRWVAAGAVFVVAMLVLKLVLSVVRSRMKKRAEREGVDWADGVHQLLEATKWWFVLAFGLYAAMFVLQTEPQVETIVRRGMAILLILQAAVWGNVGMDFGIKQAVRRRMETDAAAATMMSTLGFMGRVVLWSVALLLVLDNVGVEVSALVAGLGVGGIAVALAAQNVLGDLFASLAIVLDKPFVLGDFVIVGDYMGTIEKIGIKTTRLRSLSGEQLVFTNNDMLVSRIRNYKRMYERRIVFSLGVVYQTPVEQVKRIPEIIKAAVEAEDQTRFDRAHFKAFGDSALVYEVVYYVLAPEYNLYMDIQQAINFRLCEEFAREGIEFAYPTQTVYLNRAEPAAEVAAAS